MFKDISSYKIYKTEISNKIYLLNLNKQNLHKQIIYLIQNNMFKNMKTSYLKLFNITN